MTRQIWVYIFYIASKKLAKTTKTNQRNCKQKSETEEYVEVEIKLDSVIS